MPPPLLLPPLEGRLRLHVAPLRAHAVRADGEHGLVWMDVALELYYALLVMVRDLLSMIDPRFGLTLH